MPTGCPARLTFATVRMQRFSATVLMLALMLAFPIAMLAQTTTCLSSANNFCMSIDVFASETGYYRITGYDGSSPELTVRIGQTYTFDQTHVTNWYHPVGFAYQPDGAHGSSWGGAELPEVEGAGELQYKINGANPTCADAGDTGLACYEPEFFFPPSTCDASIGVCPRTCHVPVARGA